MHELERCDLCGRAGPFWAVARADAAGDPTLGPLGVSGMYRTVVCGCGWIFKPGVLTAAQLSSLYGAHGGAATFEERALSVARQRSARLWAQLRPHLPAVDRPLRVLDVGGGIGQAVTAFAELGHTVDILDLSAATPLDPRMRVVSGHLSEFSSPKPYDLVLMSHVLEHVWSPMQDLGHALRLLDRAGVLFVEVPFELYTPLVLHKLGDPCHVGYFSLRTLRAFLTGAGFEPRHVGRHVGLYNTRQVMVLRAIGRPSVGLLAGRSASAAGWLGTALELVAPQQMWHVARTRRPRWLSFAV